MNGAFLAVGISQGNGGDAPIGTVFATPSGLSSGWVSGSAGVEPGSTTDDYTMTALYAITGPSADVSIEEFLGATCGFGSSCDYSNAGQVAFDLPSGVSFTSDSGVFLTAQNAPEPGTLAILTGAIVLLRGVRWKRRLTYSAA